MFLIEFKHAMTYISYTIIQLVLAEVLKAVVITVHNQSTRYCNDSIKKLFYAENL